MSGIKPQFGQRLFEIGAAFMTAEWNAARRSEWDDLQAEEDARELQLQAIAKRQGELFDEPTKEKS